MAMPVTVAAGWRAEVASASRPGPIPLPPSVEVQYEFGWEKFPAAEAVVTLNYEGSRIVGQGKGKTIGPVRPIWPYQCEVTANVRAKGLTSVSFRNNERIRKQRRDTKLTYQPEKVTIQRTEKEPGEPLEEKKKWFQVPSRDLLGAALWFRSQDLKPGKEYRAVVVPGWSPYLVTIRVAERESIWLGRKEDRQARAAIRLEVKLQKIERDDSLTAFEKLKRATVWLSDDALRLPLRIEADIMVGKVYAEQTLLKTR